jgi:hypothetical protein
MSFLNIDGPLESHDAESKEKLLPREGAGGLAHTLSEVFLKPSVYRMPGFRMLIDPERQVPNE